MALMPMDEIWHNLLGNITGAVVSCFAMNEGYCRKVGQLQTEDVQRGI